MHIDAYEFGRIVIDGREYTEDCLILKGVVRPNWWRRKGHRLLPEDLPAILGAKPAMLVVGCGAFDRMTVSPAARRTLESSDIRLETLDTRRAVDRFNELAEQHTDVAGAFHLTC